MKTPIYKIELYVVDINDTQSGIEYLKDAIENSINDGLVIFGKCQKKDAGEWHDDHKLNFTNKNLKEARRIFNL